MPVAPSAASGQKILNSSRSSLLCLALRKALAPALASIVILAKAGARAFLLRSCSLQKNRTQGGGN